MVLRRPDVVTAALELLDAEGLDGLTMRRLGASLNVHGGALYRHFPSKEALLDAMADRLMAGVGDPIPPGLTWQEQCALLAERTHAGMMSRRDGARVVAGTFVTGPNTMTGGNLGLELLCGLGFTPERAAWIAFTIFYYVIGHTIEEQAQSRLDPADDWDARLSGADVPPSERLALEGMRALAKADPGERFRFGVRLLVAGIERELEERAAPGGDARSGA